MVQMKQLNSPKKRFGRYELIGFLGKGGMGRVYLANDPSLDRRVALKIPNPEKRVAERWRQMFYEEARAMAQIRHTNLCPVYEAGNVNGVDYLAMAYIEGKSLIHLVSKDNACDVDKALLLLGKLALGIHQMHRAGVIHRDLKPGNIIIDKSREPVVVDFGLACRGDQSVTQDSIVGSIGFLAPEIISSNGQDVGPSSDIYSLGTIAYLLMTGRMPFEGSTTKIYQSQLKLKPIAPSLLRPELDQDCDAVIQKALEPVPSDRYASARELANDLTQLLRRQRPANISKYRQFELQVVQGCHVLHLHSDSFLTMAELEATKQELYGMLANEKPMQLILNFASIQRCSSAAISLLAHLHLDARTTQTQLRLCGIRDSIRIVFESMNLVDEVFEIVDTVPHALRAINTKD